jgi:hypothetical protein
VLEFGDNSRVTVETTQLKIIVLHRGGIVKTELLLSRAVQAGSTSRRPRVDFRIKSPSLGASGQGTEFATAYSDDARDQVDRHRAG